jgi:RNA polymerase sigma factor (TIGR02999 family)
MSAVTQILTAIERGEPRAAEELLPLVYDELRRLAAQQLAQEKPGQTLQATALVHEAWLRLVGPAPGDAEPRWNDRRHFFRAAAEAMRRIIIDNARRKGAARHGGGWERVNIDEIQVATQMPSEQLLVVDETLERFARLYPQAAELVRLRFYTGVSQQQAAELLGVARRTADRLWSFARAWLFTELRSGAQGQVAVPPAALERRGQPGANAGHFTL